MSAALKLDLQLVEVGCSCCDVRYAVPEAFYRARRRDHRTFYCPNGHSAWWPAKSTEDLLRDELAAQKQRTQAALTRENEQRARADKAERSLNRQTKRINAGVCPCCNRTFQNLARHMASKHKDADK